jgi:purine-nucleoside phosphorylase
MRTANATLDEIVRRLEQRYPSAIEVGLVLGSGLGAFADSIEGATVVPYGEVPGLPVSTVPGHAGRYVFGSRFGIRLGLMQGRVHLYEGFDPAEVVLPVRALIRRGARILIVTNASGAVSEGVDAGDLVLIRDHVNLTFRSPLTGPNDPEVGPRFVDMQNAYDEALRALARRAARTAGLGPLVEGVYACMPGPAYETPAEIRMAATFGVDLVGMSTALEVIAARHMGARVLGISCATNRAAGRPGAVLDHEDVQQVARKVSTSFVLLLEAILKTMAEEGTP